MNNKKLLLTCAVALALAAGPTLAQMPSNGSGSSSSTEACVLSAILAPVAPKVVNPLVPGCGHVYTIDLYYDQLSCPSGIVGQDLVMRVVHPITGSGFQDRTGPTGFYPNQPGYPDVWNYLHIQAINFAAQHNATIKYFYEAHYYQTGPDSCLQK